MTLNAYRERWALIPRVYAKACIPVYDGVPTETCILFSARRLCRTMPVRVMASLKTSLCPQGTNRLPLARVNYLF